MAKEPTPETELDQRTRDLRDWVNSRRNPIPVGESFPVDQMGPDGKRKARYRRAKPDEAI
jgi:hypothetical protein